MPDRDVLVALTSAGDGVVTAADALCAGVSRSALRWAVSSGRLVRVRSGAFTTAERWEASTPQQRHVLAVRAVQRQNPQAVATGTSAAVVLGLPVPAVGVPRLSTPAANGARGGAVLGRSRPGGVFRYRGIRIVAPTMAVIDSARMLERGWGLAVADAAVAAGLVTPQELQDAVAALAPQRGLVAARWVATYARPKVESPLESLARAAIILAGFPEPEPQVWVTTRGRSYRIDLLDDANRVVTEADGKLSTNDRRTSGARSGARTTCATSRWRSSVSPWPTTTDRPRSGTPTPAPSSAACAWPVDP